MSQTLTVERITPTVFLRNGDHGFEQKLDVTVANARPRPELQGSVHVAGERIPFHFSDVPAGSQVLALYIPEIKEPCTAELCFQTEAGPGPVQFDIQPPVHWDVHVIQVSHHDVGYTDLPDRVRRQHVQWLCDALDYAEQTEDYPRDARFRVLIEQAWSALEFMAHADESRCRDFLRRVREGDFELTALFGNMTTELCGHESLIQALVPAATLKTRFGLPLFSAQHNDIPGFSWGLCQALVAAGIEVFCPGIPDYYRWGAPSLSLPSYWDRERMLGRSDLPGAFWWEAANGKRLLFWEDGLGASGLGDLHFETLGDHLQRLEARGYPYPLLRWPLRGANCDNSPYRLEICDAIRNWNRKWAFPHLQSGTNRTFFSQLRPLLPTDLPVHRGELPGQDYPLGATSTAAVLAVNRRNEQRLATAESTFAVSRALTGTTPKRVDARKVWENVLYANEHTWGYHFPCGPAARANRAQKDRHAYDAAADIHALHEQSLAALADRVRLETDDIHLLVFNSLPYARTEAVQQPLREIDNGNMSLAPEDRFGPNPDNLIKRNVLLIDRWHVCPPPDIVAGRFDLIDCESGTPLPFQIRTIEDPMTPVEYAPERLGLSQGGPRYGSMEQPAGLARDLCFVAADVPACGYRLYRLQPKAGQEAPPVTGQHATGSATIENQYYRLRADPHRGGVYSLHDIERGEELLHTGSNFALGRLFTRQPDGTLEHARLLELTCTTGPVFESLRMTQAMPGYPRATVEFVLWRNLRKVDMRASLLKDPTPLLETMFAFPFAIPDGRFTCETPLAELNPETDLLPGAFANRLTTSGWVRCSGTDRSITWTSRDAPVLCLGGLKPNRISPAHACIPGEHLHDAPETVAGDLRGGTIFSCISNTNFGTNFMVAETGLLQFHYEFTRTPTAPGDEQAAGFGRSSLRPLSQLFTKHARDRDLPPAGSFLKLDNRHLELLKLACREDVYTVRIWNPTGTEQQATLTLPGHCMQDIDPLNITETESARGAWLTPDAHGTGQVHVSVPPREIITFQYRITPAGARECPEVEVEQKGQ